MAADVTEEDLTALFRERSLCILFQPVWDLARAAPLGFRAEPRFPFGRAEEWWARAAAEGRDEALDALVVDLALAEPPILGGDAVLYLELAQPSQAAAGVARRTPAEGWWPALLVGPDAYAASDGLARLVAAAGEGLLLAAMLPGEEPGEEAALAALSPETVVVQWRGATLVGLEEEARLAAARRLADAVGAEVWVQGVSDLELLPELAAWGVDIVSGAVLGRSARGEVWRASGALAALRRRLEAELGRLPELRPEDGEAEVLRRAARRLAQGGGTRALWEEALASILREGRLTPRLLRPLGEAVAAVPLGLLQEVRRDLAPAPGATAAARVAFGLDRLAEELLRLERRARGRAGAVLARRGATAPSGGMAAPGDAGTMPLEEGLLGLKEVFRKEAARRFDAESFFAALPEAEGPTRLVAPALTGDERPHWVLSRPSRPFEAVEEAAFRRLAASLGQLADRLQAPGGEALAALAEGLRRLEAAEPQATLPVLLAALERVSGDEAALFLAAEEANAVVLSSGGGPAGGAFASGADADFAQLVRAVAERGEGRVATAAGTLAAVAVGRLADGTLALALAGDVTEADMALLRLAAAALGPLARAFPWAFLGSPEAGRAALARHLEELRRRGVPALMVLVRRRGGALPAVFPVGEGTLLLSLGDPSPAAGDGGDEGTLGVLLFAGEAWTTFLGRLRDLGANLPEGG